MNLTPNFTPGDGLVIGIGIGALLSRSPFLPDWFTVAVMAGFVFLDVASDYTHRTGESR